MRWFSSENVSESFKKSSFYDAYQLYMRGADYIFDEGYKRAEEEGVGIIDPLPLGEHLRALPIISYAANKVPRFYVFSGTKSNLQNVASYGEKVPDPRAREPHNRVQKATGATTIVNQVGKAAEDEKRKIAKNLAGAGGANFEVVFNYSKSLAQNLPDYWDDNYSYQNNMTYLGAKIIGECFLGISNLPRKYVDFLRQANDLISGNEPSIAEFEQMSQKIIQMSDDILKSNAKEILAANKYANTQYEVTGEETEEQLTEKLIKSHAAAGFIVESNLSFLLMVAIAYVSQSPKIYEKMMEEIYSNECENYNDIYKLTYLECIYRETLRYASGTAVVPRVTSVQSEMTVENTKKEKHTRTIYPNSYLFFPIRMIHHDENLWPESKVFNPSRFRESVVKNASGFIDTNFFPFSAGMRGCPAGTGFIRYAFMGFMIAFFKQYTLNLNKEVADIPKTAVHPRWKEEYFATISELNTSEVFFVNR